MKSAVTVEPSARVNSSGLVSWGSNSSVHLLWKYRAFTTARRALVSNCNSGASSPWVLSLIHRLTSLPSWGSRKSPENRAAK